MAKTENANDMERIYESIKQFHENPNHDVLEMVIYDSELGSIKKYLRDHKDWKIRMSLKRKHISVSMTMIWLRKK